MSIIYTLIARQQYILTEYTSYSGNFTLTAQQIIKACAPNKKYTKYAANNYIFYVLNSDCIYLVMCDVKYSERIAFSFLQKIRKLFTGTFKEEQINSAKTYSMMSFAKILKETVQLYNQPQQVDKVARLHKETSQVQQIINQDLQKVINRGQKIDILVRKTQVMSALSLDMKKSAKTVQTHMFWQNWKMKIILGLCVVVCIYIIFVIVCGGFTLSGCF